MNLIVNFLVFYPNNYQGGIGSHHEHRHIATIDGDTRVGDIVDVVKKELDEITKDMTRGWDDGKYILKEIVIC